MSHNRTITCAILLLPLAALALASCVAPRAPDPAWTRVHALDLPADSQGTTPAPVSGGRQAGDLTGLVGLGFTDGPDSFLLGGELDFYQSDRLAIGPMLRFGLADDVTMVAPSGQAKYRFPVDVDRRIDGAAAIGAHRTSMLQDLERGRPMEIDALVTAVQEMGSLVGVPTPTIDVVLALVQQRAHQAGLYEYPRAEARAATQA